MRQIQIQKPGGLENLKLEKVDSPDLQSNEVLMQISASSLNYHDLMVALGLIPTEDKRIPLSDGAGEIIEVGAEVTNWKVGDKVMSVCFPNWIDGPPKFELLSFIGDNEDGYATEVIAIKETAITKIPENLKAIKNKGVFTITTGHQLCVFGGPQYFIHKIISVITIVENLKLKFKDFDFIPLFWMASEDHDFQEISSLNIFNKNLSVVKEDGIGVGKLNPEIFMEHLLIASKRNCF